MLFGKSKPEDVTPEALEVLLTSLFEKKLGNLKLNSDHIVKEMENSRNEFIKACDRLEELDATPYTEDLYQASINTIKSQKSLYSKTLKRIIGEMELTHEGAATSYDEYKAILAKIDNATGEVLKTNAAFKTVLYSYSNHLGDFKRCFSVIERQRDALRHELENRSNEASEYARLKEEILRMRLEKDEAKSFEESIRLLREGLAWLDGKDSEKEVSKLSENLNAKKSELSGVSKNLASLSGKISLLTLPLDRASKKFDHMSLGKMHLNPFILDPAGTIKSEEDYKQFIGLIKKLKEEVQRDAIDAKNKDGLISSISSLEDSGLYGLMAMVKDERQKKSIIEEEMRAIETAIDDLGKGKASADKKLGDLRFMEEKVKGIAGSIQSRKVLIEKMFLNYYKKPITIAG